MTNKKKSDPWRNRIVSSGDEDPRVLKANTLNWRTHNKKQRQVLLGIMNQIGWVDRVLVNLRSGDEWPEDQRGTKTVVDGHLRVDEAIRKNEPTVPVDRVDLNPDEESLVLATLDQITTLAEVDVEVLARLLDVVEPEDDAVMRMLRDLAEESGLYSSQLFPDIPDFEDEIGEDDFRCTVTAPRAATSELIEYLDGLRSKGVRWTRR